jgi:hypothetical protein
MPRLIDLESGNVTFLPRESERSALLRVSAEVPALKSAVLHKLCRAQIELLTKLHSGEEIGIEQFYKFKIFIAALHESYAESGENPQVLELLNQIVAALDLTKHPIGAKKFSIFDKIRELLNLI